MNGKNADRRDGFTPIEDRSDARAVIDGLQKLHTDVRAYWSVEESPSQELRNRARDAWIVALYRLRHNPYAGVARKRVHEAAPGAQLINIIHFLCRPATEQLVKEMVADMRKECFDALKVGETRRAAWLQVVHYFVIAKALTLDRVISKIIEYFVKAFSKT